MADLSETRIISSVSTQNGIYFVGTGYDSYDKITTTEKAGDVAYVIWYQLWKDEQVIKEINSRLVIDVDYEPVQTGDIPF